MVVPLAPLLAEWVVKHPLRGPSAQSPSPRAASPPLLTCVALALLGAAVGIAIGRRGR